MQGVQSVFFLKIGCRRDNSLKGEVKSGQTLHTVWFFFSTETLRTGFLNFQKNPICYHFLNYVYK